MKEIATLEELDALDSDLCVAGYLAARYETPDYTQKDKSYWHGYLNGMSDKNPQLISVAQKQLAREIVKAGWSFERIANGPTPYSKVS